VASFESLEPRWLPTTTDLTPVLIQGPTSAEPGDTVSVPTIVENLGDSASGRFQVEYRLSVDSVIDSQDLVLASVRRKKIRGEGQAQWIQTL
jgi:hypothetical protein